MAALAFIMIHVGYEFDINKRQIRSYGWDYVVAMTARCVPVDFRLSLLHFCDVAQRCLGLVAGVEGVLIGEPLCRADLSRRLVRHVGGGGA